MVVSDEKGLLLRSYGWRTEMHTVHRTAPSVHSAEAEKFLN